VRRGVALAHAGEEGRVGCVCVLLPVAALTQLGLGWGCMRAGRVSVVSPAHTPIQETSGGSKRGGAAVRHPQETETSAGSWAPPFPGP
jgi:hypothetical protein